MSNIRWVGTPREHTRNRARPGCPDRWMTCVPVRAESSEPTIVDYACVAFGIVAMAAIVLHVAVAIA